MSKRAGLPTPELRPPCERPPELGHVWNWFWEIGQGRPIGPTGLLPIPPTEIYAWAKLRQIELEPWQVSLIQELDMLFLRIMGER